MSGPGSLRAAGQALLYWQRRQEINTNNLANAETAGFRAERVFARVREGGLPTLGTATDTRAGDLRKTGSPLDLALVGEGRLVVQTPGGEEYVRSGSFSLDGSGQIIDQNGHPLLGVSGPLVVPTDGPVEIGEGGIVSVAGEQVGRIRVVREPPGEVSGIADPSGGGASTDGLEEGGRLRMFSMLSTTTDPATGLDEIPESQVKLRQGYIEGSNVSALDSLIELTTIQRSFEAVQNSVRAIDSVMETISNRLGRVE